MKDSTLLFLIRKNQNQKIEDICLAMKKRGFGKGKWNGVGGKREKNESVEEATIRETKEEVGVEITNLTKVAELSFVFEDNQDWNQKVHVFFSEKWIGEPKETEEMKPDWFKADNLPYPTMWSDDIFWIPKVLENNFVFGKFKFGKENTILEKKIKSFPLEKIQERVKTP